jgi:8-oxo-dGTP diphosphatase
MTEHTAEFHYVVAGLLQRGGRALLVHRSPHRRWYPDVWDLPGGHVNEKESAVDALQRELSEELGITVASLGEPFRRLHGNDFRMDVWVVDRWLGEPENRDRCEHDALAWVDAAEAAGLELVHPHLLELLAAALDPR